MSTALIPKVGSLAFEGKTKLAQRTNQHSSYYSASFSYEVLKPKESETLESIVHALDAIDREDTLTENIAVSLSQNYCPPENEELEAAKGVAA